MTTLAQHATAGAELTIAVQERDNTIAELTLSLVGDDMVHTGPPTRSL